jgi:MerR family transcriptional regulator, light-induced transcriptional regulator
MDQELLTVAAVARRIGVAPATLRTWDRRYGLGPSSHEAGEHRRYCPSDLAKLTLMRRLIISGVAPADAAVRAKAHSGSGVVENLIEDFEVREDVVDSLHRAAKSLDKNFVETVLRKDIADNGVIASWTEVIVPLLFLVGDEWAATGTGIEVEHMLSEIIKRLLREGVAEIKDPVNAQPVLLASVGEELHCLALHALAAALAEKGIESFFLGARTPLEAISGMVKRAAPPAVFLWAQLEQNSDAKFFRDLPAVRPAPRVIVGGPGWDEQVCSGVVVAQDLTHACAEIERAVGL